MSVFSKEIYKIYSVSVNPASLAATTSAETSVSVPCNFNDVVLVQVPASLEVGLAFSGVRVSAANTIALRLTNVTSGAIDGAARTWTFIVLEGDLG